MLLCNTDRPDINSAKITGNASVLFFLCLSDSIHNHTLSVILVHLSGVS